MIKTFSVVFILLTIQILLAEDQFKASLDKPLMYDILISCNPESKEEHCLSLREDLYEDLGCDIEKTSCDILNPMSNYTGNGVQSCHYRSNNCKLTSKNDCGDGFVLKTIEGEKSASVCVLDE